MKIAPLFDPKKRRPAPKPARVDLQKVFIGGLIIWLVALIVVIIMRVMYHTQLGTVTLYTCGFGIVIGIGLLLWERWYRPVYTKLANDDPDPADVPSPGFINAHVDAKTDEGNAANLTTSNQQGAAQN